MSKSILALVLMLLSVPAMAATVTVSWVNPTLNTDGTPIPLVAPGALTQTRVEYGSCTSTGTMNVVAGSVVALAPATTLSIPDLVTGSTYCFRAFAKNDYGKESSASNTAKKTIPAPVPGAPATITVVIQ